MRLYILVRKDLSGSSPAIQAGHAVAAYLLSKPNTWANTTLIYLGIDSGEELQKWANKLSFKEHDWIGFEEPDLDNELTAIATISDGKIFSNLKLL